MTKRKDQNMNSHGASITVNETGLNWGDTCTFRFVLPEHPAPKGRIGIKLDGYQGDEYVYGARGLDPQTFTLKSNYWTGGPAHMIATLYAIDMAKNDERDLATTEFDVAA